MICWLRTRVRKQPIIALDFEFETVLKFYNLEARSSQTGQTQSSLIRDFPVCYSDKRFVNSSPENQYFIWEQKEKNVQVLEHLP